MARNIEALKGLLYTLSIGLSIFLSLFLAVAIFAVLTIHLYLSIFSTSAIPLLAQPSDIAVSVLRFTFEKYLGFPAATCSFNKVPLRIPLQDGAVLAADLFLPTSEGKPLGLLLLQTPYGRGALFSGMFAVPFARRGYMVLMVSTRGTYGSTGKFQPGTTAAVDAQQTVEWMRKQDFYPGTFATYGASYMAMAEWALLDDPPKDCIASAILVGPHDYPSLYWGTGSYPLQDRVAWSYMMGFKKPALSIGDIVRKIFGEDPVTKVVNSVPVVDAVRKHFGNKTPWLVKTLTTPNLEDPYYESLLHEKALGRVAIPVLLIGGWYDLFIGQTMHQYRRLMERGVRPVLTVGPWNHAQGSGLACMREVFAFIEEHVAGRDYKARGRSARVYMTGEEQWKTLTSFPLSPTGILRLWLDKDMSLDYEYVGTGGSSTFTFNPSEPTPTIGGNLLSGGGKANDTAFASRKDCLVYTSDALLSCISVMGQPSVSLRHSTLPHPYADLFVRLSEVDDVGQSRNICDGFMALDPERDQSEETVMLLGWCAHKFKVGTKVRLIVAGGCFPQYARNLGFGGNRCVEGEMRECQHQIKYGPFTKVTLPVVDDT